MNKPYVKCQDTNQTIYNEPDLPMLPLFRTCTQTTTMMVHTPKNHHTEALHPTKDNHWKYHWFITYHFPPPTYTKTWKPSCNEEGKSTLVVCVGTRFRWK
jgi:hypothetical protein